MYVCMVITYGRIWINRVRLPILLVVRLPDYTAGDIIASRRRSRYLENIVHVSGTSKKNVTFQRCCRGI